MILANVDVVTQVLPVDQARASGAMAIFGDKYGDVVRVLSMDTGAHKSVELCGGTHAKRTGDIGLFRIVSEKAIAAGVRRIEASTGLNTLAEVQSIEHQLSAATRLLHCDGPSLGEHLEKLLAHEKQLSKQAADLEKKLALGGGGGTSTLDQAIERAEKVGEASVLAWVTEAREAGALRQIADSLRDKLGSGVVMVAAAVAGKTQLVVTVSKPLAAKFNASNIVRAVAEVLGGSGGGRPDMAQAGCAGTDKIDAATAKFYEVVRAMA
jgi:alanyl-tRNA synthetase